MVDYYYVSLNAGGVMFVDATELEERENVLGVPTFVFMNDWSDAGCSDRREIVRLFRDAVKRVDAVNYDEAIERVWPKEEG